MKESEKLILKHVHKSKYYGFYKSFLTVNELDFLYDQGYELISCNRSLDHYEYYFKRIKCND
jgi:hypothetical protein